MSNILSALTTLYPNQVWLELSPQELEQTGSSQQEYSYDVARWTAFKNRLTLDAFLAWLKAESGVEDQPEVWPSRDDLSSFWEVVNGTAIQLGETRIILIPNEGMDINEYEVPAEWVDIPQWAADYYLAVQVNPDDCWLRVWGYATHKKLKQAGQYNSISRTYSLKRGELIEELNVMWVARELGSDHKAAIKPLPTLSPTQAHRLLEQLSQKTPYSPRLEVPFAIWGSLLASDEWRQTLYNRRVANPYVQVVSHAAAPSKKPVELRQWLRHIVESGRNLVEDGWQTFEDIFASPEPIPIRGQKEVERTSPNVIASVIRLLQPNQPEEIRYQAAGVLGEIGAGNPDAIKALTELLQAARDEETRWQAALSLGKVDPGNPQAGIKKARLIDLGMQLGGNTVALVVAIMPKADERIGVFLQVQPCSGGKLPPGLKLTVLTEFGETLQEVTARSNAQSRGKDKLLQLCFSLPPGTRFCIRVTGDNASVTENFVT
ncbi:DUF1822 family protein [Komarekiella sp. 'clone 1']|uniref:DUF1822 family protein n=1 Tax=Komarekiella delphini-convector SJRDD-AB1 TaxID=2593771 RepID=A0AA40SYK0_9NOST|nr:DUF1822 family protein [Komarekiella delphini-convector]MBD6617663.1 DUF1822 family protein [Komarekiella delphini-convector SJRDD-AB1]